MKKTILTCAFALAACSTPTPVWQITDIFLEPGEPSTLSGAAGGAANLVIGQESLTGTTGCAHLQATLDYSSEDVVEIETVEIEPPQDCVGKQQVAHDTLSELFVEGSRFRISEESEFEQVWTLETDAVDSPALRLMQR